MILKSTWKSFSLIINKNISVFVNNNNKRSFCSYNQSKHYKPRMNVEDFLRQHNVQYQSSNKTYRIKYCPFCPKHHNEDITNMYVLNLDKEAGFFHCFRCSARGSWLQFKKNVLGIKDENFSFGIFQNQNKNPYNSDGDTMKISQVQYFRYFQNLKNNKGYQQVKNYILQRGITQQTMEKYCLGADYDQFYLENSVMQRIPCIYFPMFRRLSKKQLKFYQEMKIKQISQSFSEDNQLEVGSSKENHNRQILSGFLGSHLVQISKIKVRGSGAQNKRFMRQKPRGNQSGFFGLNLIKQTDDTVVITQGQFDAMSVYQATGLPALSLPQGATNIPDSIIPYLDQFSKIFLWMDNDQAGRLGQDKISYKLGQARTHIVRMPQNMPQLKDANDVLRKNPMMIKQLISKAKTIPGQSILNFEDLREMIKNKIYKNQENQGFKLDWFKFFNKKVKGMRRGQLTIVSGATGSGKTTFLSQATVSLIQKDIPVLWGSFQITNINLAIAMMFQYSQQNLFKHKELFDQYAGSFTNFPVHYLSFHGSNQIAKVLGTIQYAVEKLNVQLVVIDTLQFMLSQQAQGFQKFQLQDTLMAKLRKIATVYNIHVIIVIHPRKTDDSQDIGIHSIYGTSKATQQADNIWIIQNRDGFKIFDVKKNRFDGQLGKSALGFDKHTKSFFELKRSQLQPLFKKQTNIDQIVRNRKQKQGKGDYEDQEDIIDPQQAILKKINRNNNRSNGN